jgi:hypothetical protein
MEQIRQFQPSNKLICKGNIQQQEQSNNITTTTTQREPATKIPCKLSRKLKTQEVQMLEP